MDRVMGPRGRSEPAPVDPLRPGAAALGRRVPVRVAFEHEHVGMGSGLRLSVPGKTTSLMLLPSLLLRLNKGIAKGTPFVYSAERAD